MKNTTTNTGTHQSVMTQEVIEAFDNAHLKGGRFIDATLGMGGHTLELIKHGATVLGIEYDQRMLKLAESRIKESQINKGATYKLIQGNFRDISDIAQKNAFTEADGILFDLGISNVQLMHPEFGFSFSNPEAKLDMRADSKAQVKAKDLLNILREDQLRELFSETLNYPEAKKLSLEVVKRRSLVPFNKVGDLLEVCARVMPMKGKINPATKVFLALRIAVNSEMENVREALPKAVEVLKEGGILAVITFHSTEDRIVKDLFTDLEQFRKGEVLTKKPISAGEDEIMENPKARSAKLRVIKKI